MQTILPHLYAVVKVVYRDLDQGPVVHSPIKLILD